MVSYLDWLLLLFLLNERSYQGNYCPISFVLINSPFWTVHGFCWVLYSSLELGMSDLDYLLRVLNTYRGHLNNPITYAVLLDIISTAQEHKRLDEESHERFLNSLSGVNDPNS
jgi:hypothetical protein